MRKRANVPPQSALRAFGASFANALTSPAAITLLGAPLIGLGVRHVENKRLQREAVESKANAYREMISLFPHFKQRDQAEVGRIYNSLHNASPAMARDPMVAGAWVDQVLENKHESQNTHQALLNAVRELNGIQKNVSDIERNRLTYSRAPAAEKWVRDLGEVMQTGAEKGLAARADREIARYDQKMQEFAHREQGFRERDLKDREKNLQRLAEQHSQSFGTRARELDERERHIQGLYDEWDKRNKTSSARTPLGEMLAALKV